jgi:hypothetical protein
MFLKITGIEPFSTGLRQRDIIACRENILSPFCAGVNK